LHHGAEREPFGPERTLLPVLRDRERSPVCMPDGLRTLDARLADARVARQRTSHDRDGVVADASASGERDVSALHVALAIATLALFAWIVLFYVHKAQRGYCRCRWCVIARGSR